MSDDDAAVPAAPPDRPTPDRLHAVLLLGAVLLVGGLTTAVVLLMTGVGVASFGWFAYAPQSEATYSPRAVAVRPGVVWSVLAATLGAVLVSGAVGYRLGRRDATALGRSRPSER